MFSYFGSKGKLAKLYPLPEYKIIVEPFAGTAQYSLLHNCNRDVYLLDKYKVITDIWEFLKKCDKEYIKSNMKFNLGDDLRNLSLDEDYKKLLGFLCNRGTVAPANIVQKWCCQSKRDPFFASTIYFRLNDILKKIDIIKDWKIYNYDYRQIENYEATWFVDPPYEFGGENYKYNEIDYPSLLDWCLSRKGQVIICENDKNMWLPKDKYKFISKSYGIKYTTNEITCCIKNGKFINV